MADKIITSLLVNTVVFSVLFCVVLPMRKIAGKRISPIIMLIMWFAVVIKLVIPFGFESGFSILPTTAAAENQPYEYAHNINNNIPYAHAETYNAIQPSDYSTNVSVLSENSSDTSVTASGNRTRIAASIDWTVIALCMWGAGAAAVTAVFFLSAANLKRRIKHARTDTPQYIYELAEQCRKELGIRRNVGIMVQSALDKPVIMGAIKPLLVLPENAGQLERDALRHVLLHELTHFKGGDLWAITFMNILRALYWFNPLVWICLRLIREDIEIACDQRVIKSLGQEHRLSYIETVLSFAGRKTPDRFAAAMGLFDGRPSMERRIKGMFGKTRTGLKGRITAGVIAVLILAVSALTACQPVSAVQSTIPAAEYEVTGHWSETIKGEKLTIEIDTDIMQSKVSEYPVVKVEPLIFTQQRVDEMVNYFAKGRKLYKPQKKTKSDYQKEIESALTPRWQGGRLVVTADEKFRASQLEKEMANAPDSYPKEYIDSTFTYDIDYETKAEKPESGKYYVRAMVENGNGNDAAIFANNFAIIPADDNIMEHTDRTSFYYTASYNSFSGAYMAETLYNPILHNIETDPNNETAGDDRKNMRIDEIGALFGKVTLDKEDARAQAEKAISDLSIKDMVLGDVSRAVSLDYPDKGGWRFEYVRRSGGIPAFDASWLSTRKEGNLQYSAPYSVERVLILVTPDGIREFGWYNCVSVTEKVSDNVKLLSFDKIKEALKETISNEPKKRLGQNYTVTVNSAELRAGYINVEDDPLKALLVPVWVFRARESYYSNSLKRQVEGNELTYMFNAIDGGVIVENTPIDQG